MNFEYNYINSRISTRKYHQWIRKKKWKFEISICFTHHLEISHRLFALNIAKECLLFKGRTLPITPCEDDAESTNSTKNELALQQFAQSLNAKMNPLQVSWKRYLCKAMWHIISANHAVIVLEENKMKWIRIREKKCVRYIFFDIPIKKIEKSQIRFPLAGNNIYHSLSQMLMKAKFHVLILWRELSNFISH